MRTLAGVLVGLAFLAGVIYFTLQENAVECEVCVRFEGRSACNTSTAADRDSAIMQATSSACSRVSGGVTKGIRCTNTPPSRLRCS